MNSSNKLTNFPGPMKKGAIANDQVPPQRYNNGNGGGGNMNDKDFVTHTELELSNEKLLRHIDEHFNQLEKKIDANKADTDLKFEGMNSKFESINTKFEKQKVWFYGTAIGIVTATCTIVGFLLKFMK
ncbi:hypothetical protein DKZ29_01720 [Limosilactobacillus reuteri]|uniref:Uncharacterized protein n=1 Tax=Limosilactobacillus reuteri TaxID=1598 RepID=A0A855XPU5_LIMRT|nr:hypothetical protein [Limosilactobacillus reuteri]PWT33874.1 hypothetical protein DKZ21_01115 [Limosilactobacillus reuteri]PWT42539.1 hypothetical protein DKZ22_03480 [Limosilactobacillus reuteri]PWT45339.1 hypothetical protein DKZ25_01115 [Limosilactobacillus reuteri]PWT60069.1 hypothetical protein DKZ29_01720 [Limosilactobacillus reuteri]PWT69395.1 hypothetical protein DKZ26_03565 [Limosilactobacillus reuteri]